MFVYNVTTKINNSIYNDWLGWAQNEFMPLMLQTGCFTHYKLYHLLQQDDDEGKTYVMQYFVESKAQYNRYMQLFAEEFNQLCIEKWSDNFITFSSLMQAVN